MGRIALFAGLLLYCLVQSTSVGAIVCLEPIVDISKLETLHVESDSLEETFPLLHAEGRLFHFHKGKISMVAKQDDIGKVVAIRADPRGDRFIVGTSKGLYYYSQGKIESLNTKFDTESITGIEYLPHVQPKGLGEFHRGKLTPIGNIRNSPKSEILLVYTNKGVFLLKDGDVKLIYNGKYIEGLRKITIYETRGYPALVFQFYNSVKLPKLFVLTNSSLKQLPESPEIINVRNIYADTSGNGYLVDTGKSLFMATNGFWEQVHIDDSVRKSIEGFYYVAIAFAPHFWHNLEKA